MKKRLSINEYVDGIRSGNRIILSKAITLIESSRKEDQILSQKLIERISDIGNKAKRIGITGVPGVGKSTFIESFGKLLTSKNLSVAVLTIDPSSQKSKGSILGDKTRMEQLSIDPLAYIRPSASGDSLGGVANKTRETILLCEAAGFNVIIIETVGVGQSEIAVKNMTDMFLLLMLAGAGDELQGIKRGIMEMADIIAITKADDKNIENAKCGLVEYQNAIHLFQANENNWTTSVTTCSALENFGISELWDECDKYFNHISENGYLRKNRINQNTHWFKELIKLRLQSDFYNNQNIVNHLNDIENKIKNSSISISKLVDEAFELYNKK